MIILKGWFIALKALFSLVSYTVFLPYYAIEWLVTGKSNWFSQMSKDMLRYVDEMYALGGMSDEEYEELKKKILE